jgi:ubiquitin-activating enzyme E1
MKVLLVGARGLGFEVAKNLVLAGPGELVVYDPNPVEWRDLGSNFFFTEADVGKHRDEVMVSKLVELNNRVKIRVSGCSKPDLKS